jgi:heptosyltransferase-3
LTREVVVAEYVAVVRGGALGDFVLTLPAIDALRARVPEADLLLVGRSWTAPLATAAAGRIDLEGAEWSRLYSGGVTDSLRRRFTGCRTLLAYLPGGEAAAPSALLDGLRELCPDLIVADPLPEPGQSRHMTSRLLDPLAGRVAAAARAPRIDIGPAEPHDAVVLHPGSGGRDKCWSADGFLHVRDELRRRGVDVQVLWGPAEAARRDDFPAGLAEGARAFDTSNWPAGSPAPASTSATIPAPATSPPPSAVQPCRSSARRTPGSGAPWDRGPAFSRRRAPTCRAWASTRC